MEYQWGGEKLDHKGREPNTLSFFLSAAEQTVRLFAFCAARAQSRSYPGFETA